MARIKEYPSIESFDGNADALAIEQTDGANNRTRKVTPAQLKGYMQSGDFTATGEIRDGNGNMLSGVANKIKKMPNTGISYTCSSTNLEYTGLSVSCPANHTYIVRAGLSFNSSAPSEILVSRSSTNTSVYNRLAYGASAFITFMLTAGETAYIWGKWGAAGSNPVTVDVIDITN